MAELIGFILVFAALALLIGTLAQGVLRVIGFAVLVVITLFAIGPIAQRVPIAGFFSPSTPSEPNATVAPTGSSPRTNSYGSSADSTFQPPSNSQTGYPSTSYPSTDNSAVTQPGSSSQKQSGVQTTAGYSRRGVRGGW